MIIDAILEYLIVIGGPDRRNWRIWSAVMGIGLTICVLLLIFHAG